MKFLILLATVLLAPLAALHGADAPAQKPNFLFIYSDDHRWDAMGVVQREQGERARFPWFKSPCMDRLAAEGVHPDVAGNTAMAKVLLSKLVP